MDAKEKLTEDELIRAVDYYIWPEIEEREHLSPNQLSVLAEQINQHGWDNLSTSPDLSAHLLRCDACLEDLSTLVELLNLAPDRSTAPRELDLSFREKVSLWTRVKEGVWLLKTKLDIRLEEAQLQLDSLAESLEWQQQSLLVPEGQRSTEKSEGDVKAGKLIAPLAEGELAAHIFLARAHNGAHLVVLGIFEGTNLLDLFSAVLRSEHADIELTPVKTNAGHLDFGVLPAGQYELKLSLPRGQFILPITIS